ncbi:hypothetical protein GIB67_009873 [Kingdonia uniflora]|uniref:Uncharacterized protein n=1 Tax=Kingdonia uniflora TaxID=39325 RepID=A0A7J7L7Y8_9MAGN|nr:hypothetical protein GIB67_009873 [Kingdonia uniflora]
MTNQASSSSSLEFSNFSSPNMHPFLPIKLSEIYYLLWKLQFIPLLKGFNIWTMSPMYLYLVYAHVVGLTCTSEVWANLECTYYNQSGIRVMQLKQQLQHQLKESLLVFEYLLKIIDIINRLPSIRKVVDEDDLILHVFKGLGPENTVFIMSITTRSTAISFTDLHGMFLSHEIWLNDD